MNITDVFEGSPLTEPVPARTIFRDGRTEEKNETLLCEHLIDVYINDVLTMKLVCTPQYLAELVLGRLLTEGIIRSIDDVASLYLCEHGARARVFLTGQAPAKAPLETYVDEDPTCCTDNHTLNDTFRRYGTLRALPPAPWTNDEVFALADHFRKGSPLHGKTGGAHSCTLASRGHILFTCEDIGRHNAVDKAIGYALRQAIPLSACMVYSSGRIPVDMARKTILAGIPVLISKAVPTRQAVELARQYHLTLLCSARTDSMRQYA